MIIFGLEGILANDEHRRNLINLDKYRHPGQIMEFEYADGRKWKPDWNSYYEACDKDEIIKGVDKVFDYLAVHEEIQIFSTTPESYRNKIICWLYTTFGCYSSQNLKMRPIGNTEPEEVLKERWLEDTLIETKWGNKFGVDFVFESHKPSIEMYRSYGIFVFDCNQGN